MSCGPTATFDSPQPEGIKEEKHFDKKTAGTYQSLDSTSQLFVKDRLIIARYYDYKEILIDSLNSSSFKLSNDTLINLTTTAWEIVQRTDSSVIRKHPQLDTVFQISQVSVLKKYKGHYFLNWQNKEDKTWTVTKMNVDKEILTLASINGKEDIDSLNEITKTPKDSTKSSINYDLDKKKFKMFLKSDGFRNIDTFVRVKN